MLRRLLDAVRSLLTGVIRGIREVMSFLGDMARHFDPRNLPALLAGSGREAVAGSKAVATTTAVTFTDVARRILWSPVDLTRWLITAPGRFWFFLKTQSPIRIAISVLVIVAFLAGAVWPTFNLIRERRIDAMRREQYRQFDEHAIQGNFEGARKNLEVLLKSSPNDATIAARLKAMDEGNAPASDARMIRLLSRRHLSQGRFDECVREAKKYLELEPRDWESLILVAEHALAKGDRAAASAAVSKLPRASAVNDMIPLWSCGMAEGVFRRLGDDTRIDDLIEYVCNNYVPAVRISVIGSLDPGLRLQLVQLYNLALTQLNRRPRLTEYWAAYQDLCHGIANSPNTPAGVLEGLGKQQELQVGTYLRQMLQMKLITPEQHAKFAKEIEDRLAGIWKRLRSMDPKSTISYAGLAMQMARTGKLRDALTEIDAGIAVCGSSPDLVERKVALLRMIDPAQGLAFVDQFLAAEKVELPMCKVAAESALAASRPDKALEAIRRAHTIAPDQPWALRLEGETLLVMGRKTEAAAVFKRLVESVGLDGSAVMLYIRALVGSGAAPLAEQFLLQSIVGPESVGPAIMGANELLRLGRAESAAVVANRLLLEDPTNVFAHLIVGESIRTRAEQDTRLGWDRNLVDEAIKSFRTALSISENEPRALVAIADLQLRALELPREAAKTLQPIAQLVEVMPAEMLRVVGAIEVASGKYDAGRQKLLRALQMSGPHDLSTAYVGFAYHGLNQTDLANDFLKRAVAMPKSSPRNAEQIEKIRLMIARGLK